MIVFYIIAYAFIGTIAGIIGGMLGIGGGAVTVPSLFFLFSFMGFPKETTMQWAVATSLACTAVNAFAASYFHNRKKTIDWAIVRKMLPGIIIGSVIGSLLVTIVSGFFLKVLFGLFAFSIAVRFMKTDNAFESEPQNFPGRILFSIWGTIISCLSNLLGVGGGIFVIPLLTFYRFNPRKSIGTSSCLSFLISSLGIVFFLSKSNFSIKDHASYIYLPAFFIIGFCSVLSSRYGVRLAGALPLPVIRKTFAGAMIIAGIFMVF